MSGAGRGRPRRPAEAPRRPAQALGPPKPSLPRLDLSLQFARDQAVRSHRAVLPRHRVARWIRAALAAPAEVTVRIVGSDEARALNRDYRGRDYATNVLTFGYADGAPTPAGDPETTRVQADLVLCAEVVEAEALALALPLEAHYAHLLVHGVLHAQGHDHERDDAAAAMELRETELLLSLGFADPYRPR